MKHPNFILFILIISLNVSAKKKLVIHKCIKSNGTISYQDNPCKKKYTKPRVASRRVPTYKSIPHKKIKPLKRLAQVNIKDKTTHTITNKAKGYHFSIKALKRWQTINKVYNNKLVHMKFLDYIPKAEMSLMIDFIFPDNKNFSTLELQELVALVGNRYIKGSKEGAIFPYELNVIGGKGVMATFTHSNMVPNYNYATRGALFKGKWLIQFTLLSNSQQSHGYLFALQALTKSIKIH